MVDDGGVVSPEAISPLHDPVELRGGEGLPGHVNLLRVGLRRLGHQSLSFPGPLEPRAGPLEGRSLNQGLKWWPIRTRLALGSGLGAASGRTGSQQ